jgi:hypothetical protein
MIMRCLLGYVFLTVTNLGKKRDDEENDHYSLGGGDNDALNEGR